jgi:hypothetical protein
MPGAIPEIQPLDRRAAYELEPMLLKSPSYDLMLDPSDPTPLDVRLGAAEGMAQVVLYSAYGRKAGTISFNVAYLALAFRVLGGPIRMVCGSDFSPAMVLPASATFDYSPEELARGKVPFMVIMPMRL